MVRGIRGAITVKTNTDQAIRESTCQLLAKIVEQNNIELGQIVSVIFSATKDLDAETPAYGARLMGWTSIPLFCTLEMEVPNTLTKCIRVLLHINTDKSQEDIQHIYLEGAKVLRPDLTEGA